MAAGAAVLGAEYVLDVVDGDGRREDHHLVDDPLELAVGSRRHAVRHVRLALRAVVAAAGADAEVVMRGLVQDEAGGRVARAGAVLGALAVDEVGLQCAVELHADVGPLVRIVPHHRQPRDADRALPPPAAGRALVVVVVAGAGRGAQAVLLAAEVGARREGALQVAGVVLDAHLDARFAGWVGSFDDFVVQVKKEKVWEQMVTQFTMSADKVALFDGKPMTTPAGQVTAPNLGAGNVIG